MDTFNGDFTKLILAIQVLAQQTAEPTVYARQFHILALASVIDKPIFPAYPDIPSAWAVKLASHGYIHPRNAFQSELSRKIRVTPSLSCGLEPTECHFKGREPNHFVLLVQASAISSSKSYATVVAEGKPRMSADTKPPKIQVKFDTPTKLEDPTPSKKRATSDAPTWQKSTTTSPPQKRGTSGDKPTRQKSTDPTLPNKQASSTTPTFQKSTDPTPPKNQPTSATPTWQKSTEPTPPKKQLTSATPISQKSTNPTSPKNQPHPPHLPVRNQQIPHLPNLPRRNQQIPYFLRSGLHPTHLPHRNQQIPLLSRSELHLTHLPGRKQQTVVIVKP